MSYPQTSFMDTKLLEGSLIKSRRDAAWSNTLLYQLNALKETGRYDAFKLQKHPSYDEKPDVWPVPNHLFWDSDVAKWIEGACYFLTGLKGRDHLLEDAIEELVEMIRSAQQPDGYINIHYTVVEPGDRYNCGHLIEAALAHEQLFHNNRLLDPMLTYVDLLCGTFGNGDGQTAGYPGHPEIELALLRLYDHTKDPKHLRLAAYFITERGNPRGEMSRHYFDVEAERRREDPTRRPDYYPAARSYWYHQAHVPLIEQDEVKGHSVRMMYLLTAVADLVRIEGEKARGEYKEVVNRLWKNMVGGKMYVTGGIGAIKQWEGFGPDYFLPQGSDEGGCYAETCAAIGVMMTAERMLQVDLDRRFGDIMELCLYNSVLTSMSIDGRAFTYINQLASSETDPARRASWFKCACCPPNILRLLGQIGGYVWTKEESNDKPEEVTVNVHLYMSSETSCTVVGEAHHVKLRQESSWPWSGDIKFSIEEGSARLNLRLRIPEWADSSWTISPRLPCTTLQNGYLHIPSDWIYANPNFTLHIPLQARFVSPHRLTGQDTVTLVRGPVVYCVEDVDNTWVQDHFRSLALDPSAQVIEEHISNSEDGESYIGLLVKSGAVLLEPTGTIAAPSRPTIDVKASLKTNGHRHSMGTLIESLRFVPYYYQANRGGRGQMRVGLRRWTEE